MFFQRINKEFRRWRQERRTINELSRLTLRQLEDIGLAPYQIEDAARGKIRR